MRFHMASLLHSGCPQVIQGPSCMYSSGPNSDQHMWPGQSNGSALISPEPPNALAPRLLSCRCAWSFQITETHEAVCPRSVPLPWCFWPLSMKFQLGNSLCCLPLCNSYSAIQLTKVSFSSRKKNFFSKL